MNEAPRWYWVLSGALLLVGVAGVWQWLPYYTEPLEGLAGLDPELFRIWTEAPTWAEIGYGVGILGSCLGGAGAVLQRSWARWAYAASVTGLLAHRAWLLGLSGMTELLPAIAPVSLFVPVLIDGLAIWAVSKGVRDGWVQ